ncbi:MAG TPA: HypC/HybG/HupF family hydrogenase formation chaperone [Candidatus Acidoferrales bacterium]|jgi:hydrogenase expression/formation protein HypC|nr:HypC/HybG/HupF family hydrogenase formation chaperone [Candidatus Acidoferrales bacterium]
MCLAIPGKIVDLLPANHSSAVVDVAGVRRRVDLGLLENDPPVVGDWVLIHVGFAMSKISERDAIDQMNTLAILGEAEAAMQEVRGYGLDDPHGDEHSDAQSISLQPTQPGALRKFEPS